MQNEDTRQTKKVEKEYSLDDVKTLVGFNKLPEDATESSSEEATEPQTNNVSLIEPGDFDEPEEGPRKRKPWEGSWIKLAAVGTPIGLISLVFGFVLVSVTSMKLSDDSGKPEVVADVGEDAVMLKDQQQEEEIAQLKTSNALGNQASVLDSQPRRTEIRPQATPTSPQPVAAQPRQPSPTATTAPPKPTAVVAAPSAVRSRPVAVARPLATPRPVAVARPAAATTQVVNRRAAAPQQTVTRVVQSQPALRQEPTPQVAPVDPYDAWAKLAAVGSYGQVTSNSDAAYVAATPQLLEDEYTGGEQPENLPIPIMVSYRTEQNDSRAVAAVSAYRGREFSRPLPEYMEANGRKKASSTSLSAKADDLSGQAKLVESQPDQLSGQMTLVEPQPELSEQAPISTNVEEMEQAAEAVSTIREMEQPLSVIDRNQPILLASANIGTQDTYESGVSFIMGNRRVPEPSIKEILPGISAKGSMVTPIAWAGDIQSTSGAISLTEDLVSGNTVVMPAGTQLIVNLKEMSASGMMALEVTSIVLPESGFEHMQIPASAISVQGADGQVLMAREVSGTDGELRRLDIGQAFLGALGQVGSILNRPNSSISTISTGGAASSTDYGSPNILGAVLEGGTSSIINQQAERNRTKVEALEDRPLVWVLESGTDIEVFISQRVAL